MSVGAYWNPWTDMVEAITKKEFTKPLAIYIGGKFAKVFPEGMNVGHAGAIVARGQGAAEKEAALARPALFIICSLS